jgi:hypothetical protein
MKQSHRLPKTPAAGGLTANVTAELTVKPENAGEPAGLVVGQADTARRDSVVDVRGLARTNDGCSDNGMAAEPC